MKVLCGTDIIEVARIKKAIESDKGKKFLNKVYTENEIDYCNSKGKNKYQHYAARFAAKEALYKAISENYNDNKFVFKDIEIKNTKAGKPFVVFNKKDKDNINVDISLSHIKEYAIANCVVTFWEEET